MNQIYEKPIDAKKHKWWAWHKKNPKVWNLFVIFSFEAIKAGHKHYSHWAVMQRIRWHTDVETKGDKFKISNDWFAYYARLFHAIYPEYNGFFRIKPLKSERITTEENTYEYVSNEVRQSNNRGIGEGTSASARERNPYSEDLPKSLPF